MVAYGMVAGRAAAPTAAAFMRTRAVRPFLAHRSAARLCSLPAGAFSVTRRHWRHVSDTGERPLTGRGSTRDMPWPEHDRLAYGLHGPGWPAVRPQLVGRSGTAVLLHRSVRRGAAAHSEDLSLIHTR